MCFVVLFVRQNVVITGMESTVSTPVFCVKGWTVEYVTLRLECVMVNKYLYLIYNN